MPTVINISNGNTRAGSQRAIHSFMRFDSLTRDGYSPNSMAMHPAMSEPGYPACRQFPTDKDAGGIDIEHKQISCHEREKKEMYRSVQELRWLRFLVVL